MTLSTSWSKIKFSLWLMICKSNWEPRGYSTNVCTGRVCPKVQPLNLLCTIFHDKVPFCIPSNDKWYPFYIPCSELCTPFSSCKCTLLNRNQSQKYSWFFQSHKSHLLAPLSPFTDPNDRLPYPFIYTSTSEIPLYPFIYLKPEKGTPFRWSLPVPVYCRPS